MSFEVTGKLTAVYDTVQRTETFKTREFVIEKQDDIGGRIISNFIKFQCVQDKTDIPGRFNVGDELKVSFNLKGTRWEKNGNVNYITNLDAWRIENAGMMQGGGNGQQGSSQQSNNNQQGGNKPVLQKSNTDEDDLPDVPDDLPF